MNPVWSRRVADEFWSGPVTPLTFSLLAEPMADHMVRRALEQAGRHDLAAEPVLLRHASHVYVNGALLGRVVGLLPNALRSAGVVQLLPDEVRATLAATSTLTGAVRTAEMVARFALQEPAWSPWQRAAAFERAAAAVRARFAANVPPSATAGVGELVAELRDVRAALGAFLETVSWGVVFAYVFFHLLHELCRRWAPGSDADVADLTVGLPGIASLRAARDVEALGRLLPAGGPEVDATVRAIVAEHGHRLVGRDLSCPTWRETPDVVLRLALRTREAAADADAHSAARAELRRSEATARIEHVLGGGLGGPVRLAAFRAILHVAQRYYVVRENMRYYADFFLARMRTLALAAGARLVDARALADATDVFYLELAELERAAAGGPIDVNVAERRVALARDAIVAPPPTLPASTGTAPPAGGATVASSAPRPAMPESRAATVVLVGECAATGSCRGVARVVRDPDDFAAFERGDVMVAAYTDPGWTSILELASGLVLDAGGQLSHGAIVARELGIPALVNVADATRTIASGDLVELDATNGTLRIVAPATERVG